MNRASANHFTAPATLCSLRRLVRRLHVARFWQEDLVQEALVHLWRQELSRPGQSWSWYLRSCEFHLRNFLRKGRSVDSPKRCRNGGPVLDAVSANPGGPSWTAVEGVATLPDPASPTAVVEQVAADELIQMLTAALTPAERQVLRCLLLGLSARETALRLGVSHTHINQRRHRIVSRLAGLLNDAVPRVSIRARE